MYHDVDLQMNDLSLLGFNEKLVLKIFDCGDI